MNKKIIGIVICVLMIIATILPVAGTLNNQQTTDHHIASYSVDDFMNPAGTEKIPVDLNLDATTLLPAYLYPSASNRAVPDYEFIKMPTTIMTSYSDYMPSSYTTHPIRLQTDNGNGQYITFHAKPATTGNRRQYYGYVNSTYVIQSGTINPVNENEGYGSIAIHPATGDAIASWHKNADYTTKITYDDYDAVEIPGAWKTPMTVTLTPDMQYIWPVMYIGPSPQGEGYVRVYQVNNNFKNIPGELPCEDVRIKYIDVPNVNGADLSSILGLANWTNVTVFTSWRDKACRPFQSFAIDYNHPGKVAFIGTAAWLNGDVGDMPVDEGIFVWESLDYGQTWDTANLHSDGPGEPIYRVHNPGFEGAPDQLDVTVAGFHNTALYDSYGNLHWTFIQSYGYSDGTNKYYFPNFMPQAEVIWDGNSFTFVEVPALPGIDSLTGHTVPWIDIDHLYPIITWSTYPTSSGADIFHENTQKQAINMERNWLVQMWADGTYATLGAAGDPDYADYVNHPILFISVSPDNGYSWSDPIELTDIHSTLFDFSQQITVYPYLCDQITDLGDNWGQIYITYFDDNDFGSNVQGTGPNTGGQITYCSLKIKFPEPGALTADADGPYEDILGEPIQFIGTATGGLPQYTWQWDLGDGTTANVKNPLHEYLNLGTYTVTLTVTDSSDPQQTASDTTSATITEPPCFIDINISGGIGISVNVTNIGENELTDIPWNITIEGGLLVFPREKSGTIDSLAAGDSTEIIMKVFGIGLGILKPLPTITVTVGCAEANITAKILFTKVTPQ